MTIAPAKSTVDAPEPRYLVGPVSDFLMLGGATFLLFPIMMLLPVSRLDGAFASMVWWAAFAINHPHFAVSYRIFYENFGDKVAGRGQADPTLRYRYAFAGMVAPVLLGLALLGAGLSGNRDILAQAFNVMGFFVGWHYVKQGYGMVMVDAALKRRFLSAVEKKALLINAYAVWAFAWTSGNNSGAELERWGLTVKVFDLPDPLVWATGAAMGATTVYTIFVLGRRALAGTPTAWIGLAAYVVSLYLWLILVRSNPLMVHLTPALHSLQYLWIVRAFQRNRNEADKTVHGWGAQYLRSVALGGWMFLAAPVLLEIFVDLPESSWGTTPFFFTSIIFINIHHYFLDNVMWRRGNPEVSQHLFA